MYDVITFGSASEDIYLKSKKFFPVKGDYFTGGKGLCFNSGSKIELEDALFFSGGGGTNAAATFARQGFKTAFCGMVGQDHSGDTVIKDLQRFGIDTSLVCRTGVKKTNISIILAYPGQDKTVLVFRGASDDLAEKNIPWEEIKNTKWFYFAPFSGKLAQMTRHLVDFAKENGIRVAFNPGYSQLRMKKSELNPILGKIDILILNQEEAAQLTGTSFSKEKEIFKKLDLATKGICIMTKGEGGVVVSDGKNLYSSKSFKVKVTDTTGAGDAFGAGFVSGLMENDDITFGIQLGIANSVANIKAWGAKEGLLKAGEEFEKAAICKTPCDDSVCIKK